MIICQSPALAVQRSQPSFQCCLVTLRSCGVATWPAVDRDPKTRIFSHMHFFPHAITSTPDRLFVALFDLPWSTPPLYGMAAKNAIVLPSSVFSWQSQEQFYAVHVMTCQTRKRFVALDGRRWNGEAGVRSCQFCGTSCSNVDHQSYVTRCRAQLLSVVITLFVTVLLLPFPSDALSIAKIAFYLFLLAFSILSQPL